MRYVAFLHGDDDASGFGISFPDFPGCVSGGDTVDDALSRGGEALAFHAGGMLADGEAIPQPRSLQEIKADESIAEWLEGATIAFVPLILDRGSPRRINISLDFGLLHAIDAEAKRRGMTRSEFLSSAARNEIEGR